MTSTAHAPFEQAVTPYVCVTAALPVFAGSVSVGDWAADQLLVVPFRQFHEVTAPPPVHEADNEIAPPLVPSEPFTGVRVIAHPLGALAGGSVVGPCQTTATDAEPVKPADVAAAVYTQLRPPAASLTFACPTAPGVGVVQSREALHETPVAAGEQATESAAVVPPLGLTGLDCATQVMAACVQVIV